MDCELRNMDIEDIEDVLRKVEASFDVKFIDNELSHIVTFGELCDYITNKIQLKRVDSCTTQQAFYKLRNILSISLSVDKKFILPDSELVDFLPKQSRRKRLQIIENELGFKLGVLRPKKWIIVILGILLLTSFILLFFNWQVGLLGTLFSIGGFRLANKMGNEIELKTIRQVIGKITRENYLKSRRDPNTINKKEVEKTVRDLFCNECCLEENKLTRESRLI